jgi:very-short-patch-repair endonuclease
MESRVRLGLTDAGLPRPKAQWAVRDAAGGFVARLDLAYPEHTIAIEYDGAWHWKQRRQDDRRRDAARRLGWHVVVVSADDYYGSFEATCRELAELLRSRSPRKTPSSATISA